MNIVQREVTIEQLASGEHEKCAWCRANFVWTQGSWQRHLALDGKYYCDATHASAQYLQAPKQWKGWR